MYAGLPTVAPSAVMGASVVVASMALAIPKSASLTRPSAPTGTLSGLTSRWVTTGAE